METLRDRHGFTLLELVVALTLTAIVAGVGVLAYQRVVEDLRLNQAARQVVLALTVARARALADNVGHRVVFDVDDNVYQSQQQSDGRYDDDGNAVALPAGVRLTECSAVGSAVAFRPRGNATVGTITLRNPSGRERRVKIDLAGRIRVE